MKKDFAKLILLVVSTFVISSLIYSQGVVMDGNKNSESATDYDLDKLFKASSSKYAIETQIIEIKELIKQKQKEIEYLETLDMDYIGNTDTLRQKQISIDQEWKTIKEALLTNSPNYKNLIERGNALLQRFYPINTRPYYGDNTQPLIISKITQAFTQQIQSIRDQLNIGYFTYKSPDYIYTKADVENLLLSSNTISDSTYKKFLTLYFKLNETQKLLIKQKIEERKLFINKAYNKIEELNKVSEEKDISINQNAISIGLPWFCITVIILFGFTFFYKKIFSTINTQSTNTDDENSMAKVLLEVITVLLITLTVLILGLARIITENVLGTLLGGIAGYILNRNKK